MKYIIENLEEISEWVLMEYEHISEIVGKDNLIFTNTNSDKLKKFGTVKKESFKKLNLKSVLILDPHAKEILKPNDAKEFEYVVLGGILGDHPPQNRTKEVTKGTKYPTRHLEKMQMSTDTAALVAHTILNGKPFEKIKFIDNPIIKTGKFEEVLMPYRYVEKDNKPIMPKGMIKHLKEQNTF